MRNLFFSILLSITSLLLLCSSCDTGLQTYVYAISNQCSSDAAITVNYTVTDDTAKTLVLEPGEEAIIAERADVPSKDVWDVETSKSLYKIKSISAVNSDSSRISEQMAYRKFWEGPNKSDGKGKYILNINDSLLCLQIQKDYRYYVQSDFEDTLFITSYLKNQSRRTDTIIGKEKASIGSADIYTYEESMNGLPKYKTQKITGIYSITLWHGSDYKNVNLSKDTSHFVTTQDSCLLLVTSKLFY